MAVKPFLLRGAIVSAGSASEYAAQMVRMLVLARLLGPVEFGIVVSLNALYALVTMSTWVGVERFLIHVSDGHRRSWLGVAHTLSFLKGILGAIILLLLAWPTTELLAVPNALGSFMALALVPLLSAPSHMRIQQLQRQHVFWPGSIAAVIGNFGGLLVSIGAAFLLRDHSALVWGLCATSALNSLATHFMTRVPYRISFVRSDLGQALRFGLPLMLNGFTLAILSQLDRLVVGAMVSVASLGRYGLAMTIVLTPISLMMTVATLIFQPHLSAAWHSPVKSEFPRVFRRMTTLFAIVSTAFALGVAMLGNILLPWLFGPSFAVGDGFMAILSVLALVRFVKTLVNLGGLSTGRTFDLMLSNAAGAFGLLITALILWWEPTLIMATIGSLTGEVLATLFVIYRLDRLLRGTGASSPLWDFVASIPALAGVILWTVLADPPWTARLALIAVLMALIAALGWRLALPPAQPERA